MGLAYGIGGFVKVAAGPIKGFGPPATNFKGELGQQYFDQTTVPPTEYVFNGSTWTTAGANPATTTTYGTVLLTDNNEPVATKFYVDNTITAGAPVASITVQGIVTLATDVKAVAGTASTALIALAVQPSNLAAVFAAPPATGGTTPAAGAFTTLAFTTMSGSAGGNWLSGGTAINIGTDASNDAISIGTAGTRAVTIGSQTSTSATTIDSGTGPIHIGTAIAKTIAIGNATTSTAVTITSGTGSIALASTSTGDITLNSSDTLLLDSSGVLELNSSAGAISVGNDAVNQNISIGTAGTRLITIGNLTSSTEVLLNFGTDGLVANGVASSPITIGSSNTTGAITIGGTAQSTGAMTFGSSSANYTTNIAASTGAGVATLNVATGVNGNTINIGTGINTATQTVNIATGASAADSNVNILTGAGSASAASLNMANNSRVNVIGIGNVAPAATRTTTINGGNSAQNDTVNILNGAPSANTQTVSVLSGTATGGTQVLNLGNSIAGALTVNMGNGINSTAQTVNISNGASAGDSTVNILSGIGTSGVGVLALGNNTRVTTIGLGNIAPAAARVTTINGGNSAQNDTVTILGGAASAGTQTFNLFSGNSAGATQNINIATGTGAFGLNIGTGVTGVKTIAIGGTAANVITLADTQTAGSLSIGSSMTTGTVVIGSTAAGIGLVTLFGGTGNQTINLANNTGVKTINIAGDSATSANVIKIGTGGSTTSALTIGSTTGGSTTTINSGTGNVNVTGGHLAIASVAKTLLVNGGAVTDFIGTGVLTGGTQTILNTNIATGDVILITRLAVNASTALGEFTYTISNGVSFTVTSMGVTTATILVADVSSYAYFIVRPT